MHTLLVYGGLKRPYTAHILLCIFLHTTLDKETSNMIISERLEVSWQTKYLVIICSQHTVHMLMFVSSSITQLKNPLLIV